LDLKHYVRVLREQWWLIVTCVLVAVGLAAALAWTSTPKYGAHVKLFVSTKDSTDATAAYQGGLFGQQRVKSYADIVASDRVVSAVKSELKLPDSVGTLQSEITGSAPLDTVLVNVTVTDTDRARARDIANAVGRQFSTLVNELETPQGQTVSPIKVSVVEPASLPGAPVSPNKKLDLVLGLLIGLAVGVGVAVLRETLDTSVGGREEAAELVDAPVLAAFREDEKVRTRPLIVNDDSFSPRAEAFRQLRTNIRYLSLDRSVKSLVVTSSVESEGKTTVAANLAIALAQSGEQVILVDADLRRPRVAELLGLNPQVGLTNVMVGTAHIDEALATWREGLPLRVLTAGEVPPNPSEMLGSHRMDDVLKELLARSSVVVFDSPPLLPVTDAAILTSLTDGALLVARAGKTRRDALASSAESLRRVGGQVLGVVLNRVPARNRGNSYGGYGYGYGAYYSSAPKIESSEKQPAGSV
jgi:succinoglycan biosynthesis transport protein ExoP